MPLTKTKQPKDRVAKFFRQTFKDRAAKEMEEGAVLDLVRQGKLSSGKAAELLGISRWDMPDLLVKHRVPMFELLPDETLEEHLTKGEATLRVVRGEPV